MDVLLTYVLRQAQNIDGRLVRPLRNDAAQGADRLAGIARDLLRTMKHRKDARLGLGDILGDDHAGP